MTNSSDKEKDPVLAQLTLVMAGRNLSQKTSLENTSIQSGKSHGTCDKLKALGNNKACKSFDVNSSSLYKTKSSTRNNYGNSWRHRNKNNQGVSSNFNLSGGGNNKGRKKQFQQACHEETDMPVVEKFQQKKINLNHLLNFSYDPVDCDGKVIQRSKTSTKYRGNRTQTKVYNKEKFLQANCQFVVREEGSYDIHAIDPDVLVEWDSVEQIHIWSEKVTKCPICLDPPYAAKITRCGHIYCGPCVLHYLALDNKPWRKCPICHEAVHKKDLKSVCIFPEENHSVGDTVTMKLMQRYRGSVIPAPVGESVASDTVFKYGMSDHSEPRYWKVLTADKNMILNRVIDREMDELLTKKVIEEDELELMFIESAIAECKERQNVLLEAQGATNETSVATNESSVESDATDNVSLATDDVSLATDDVSLATDDVSLVTDDILLATDDVSLATDDISLATDNVSLASDIDVTSISTDEPSSSTSSQTHSYYFYQATDDQNLFLHPLNIRCLVKEFGSLEKCPQQITAKILEIQNYSMDEQTRKRHRYLSHLPLSCEFGVAELKLKPPTVSQRVLNEFSQAIEERAVQRKKKSREEKRVLRRMQVDEMKKHGVYPAARISLESNRQFPAIEPARANEGSSFSVLVSQPVPYEDVQQSDGSNMVSPLSGSVGSYESSSTDNSNNGFSFASMLRNNATGVQPRWHQLKPSPVSAGDPRPVTPDEAMDPDYVPPPTYQSTFSEALGSALDNLDKAPKSTGGGKRRQKKGKKKVLLFSTASHVPHS